MKGKDVGFSTSLSRILILRTVSRRWEDSRGRKGRCGAAAVPVGRRLVNQSNEKSTFSKERKMMGEGEGVCV